MLKSTGILLATLVVLALGAITVANAAVTYDAILEWNGPYFHVINNSVIGQLVDDPATDLPFVQPNAVAAQEHTAGNRDVVYVVDSGHNRVQAFEANGSYYNDNTFTFQAADAAAAANDCDQNEIYLAEWIDVTGGADDFQYIIPGSESVIIDGIVWTSVASLATFSATDNVYHISYDYSALGGPIITLPANSLTATSSVSLKYALTNYKGTLATDFVFGSGDVDYGVDNTVNGTPVLAEIDEAVTNGPDSWQNVRSIAVHANGQAATSDDMFLVDGADNSAGQDEELFSYIVTAAGAVTASEQYDDVLTNPGDVAVASGGPTEIAASVSELVDADGMLAGLAVVDHNQVTGHDYEFLEDATGLLLTITDLTTGQVLLNAATIANLDITANHVIPGLAFDYTTEGSGDAVATIRTVRALADRYLFVADTGADRIKVISAYDNAARTATNTQLPGDAHAMVVLPGANIGSTLVFNQDYRYTTPASVPADYSVYTAAYPIKEGSLETITFDPAGTPVEWTRVDDLVTAGPSDLVFMLDWTSGTITFGDGIHGAIPENTTVFEFDYTTTPDVLRYGSSGTGPGRFSAPRGIAARWNIALGQYDVYVADTGNNRIQKLAFIPANIALNQPARMDYVCEWTTASTSLDLLDSPVDIAVQMDQNGTTNGDVYLAVADQGNNRVVTYVDNAAITGGGTTAPAWDALSGILGNGLGRYMQATGLCFLKNGNDLDIYATDATRGFVTKYEKSPTPTVTLTFTGVSTLPACFPPTSSYTFTISTTNPPSGGWIDFYYDSSDTFDESTAKLAIATGTVEASATTAVWSFADTPDGVPADGTSYYLFARMKDATGTVVATDQTTSSELFCMDSTLLPGLRGTDRIDGDWTLYLQNGLERTVDLQVAYPESIIVVGFGGTFPVSDIEILGISQGNGWDATSYINALFNQGYNNTTGTFIVNTSVTGAPIGLVTAGPHTLAVMSVRSGDTVLTATNRTKTGSLAILAANSGMTDINMSSPSQWVTRNVNLRWGYLGDIATSGAGADSILPHLAPKPDGKINFEDQMIFTVGWNGTGNVQDRISDIGPTLGTVPDLQPVPDGLWNVDDLLAFTLMYSWAAGQGYYKDNNGLNLVDEVRPVALGEPVRGAAVARTSSNVDSPKAGAYVTVDLNVDNVRDLSGALLNVGFDPARLELVSVDNGGFLNGQAGSLFFNRSGQGWLEVSATRLDQQQPGVSGRGTIARATFRILDENAGDLDLQYDLRTASGTVLSRGNAKSGAYAGSPTGFQLLAAHPNPVRGNANIVYALPTASDLSLNVYDVTGRQVRSLVSGRRDAGYHVAQFDGRDDSGSNLPGGVYFYRLQANGQSITQKLTLTR